MGAALSTMQEIQGQIETYQNISRVFFVLMILLLIAAAAEFFLLDMMQIIRIRTGIAARKGIRRLEARNAGDGRMQRRAKQKAGYGESGKTADGNRTMPLENEEKVRIGQFVIETDMVLIHTDERI